MMNLYRQILLASIITRWIWTHGKEPDRQYVYSIVVRSSKGSPLDTMTVIKYNNGVSITNR